MKFVLASGNPHKVHEINARLQPLGIEAVAQSHWRIDEAEESGLSFVENAIIKARHAAAVTGLPALADDSGIEVDALGGAPGVYSARYAGEPSDAQKNLEKLLHTLKDLPANQRGARFVCVIVYLRSASDATPIICEGYWSGSIALAAKGVNGFGYDPIFQLPELACTVAELSDAQKNRLSHRARALDLLEKRLRALQKLR